MRSNKKIRKSGSKTQEQTGLAVQLKYQMNDLIDVAYGDGQAERIRQYKRFTIFCTTNEMLSKHGDCRFNREEGSSSIRVLNLAGRNPNDILITTIHEVAHHIDFCIRGTSNHDKNFYAVIKKLLCAALDMGILSKDDLVNIDRITESHSSGALKIGKMMAGYVPRPVEYKQGLTTIAVYNSYPYREQLKQRGYHWNSLDQSWYKEIQAAEIDSEKEYLSSLGISADDMAEKSLKGVAIRQRKIAHLYNVPFEHNAIVKELGFRWSSAGKEKHWAKTIPGNDLTPEEREKLRQIPAIRIVIT